ncbi:hypothetical protein [Streptosporangium saharense]|uniref:hypothetical protein n=1 Tax=Streptosporangium saharense TaxID=1706840 RepID=UPI0036C4ED5B
MHKATPELRAEICQVLAVLDRASLAGMRDAALVLLDYATTPSMASARRRVYQGEHLMLFRLQQGQEPSSQWNRSSDAWIVQLELGSRQRTGRAHAGAR